MMLLQFDSKFCEIYPGLRARCMAAYLSMSGTTESVSVSLIHVLTLVHLLIVIYRYRNVYFHKRMSL